MNSSPSSARAGAARARCCASWPSWTRRPRAACAPPGRRADGLPSAVVFQEQSLFPWMRVAENVAFAFDSLGLPKSEVDRRVAKELALVGLSNFANAYPHELSGGMKQRAAVARAFAVDPPVLYMDEPFGALDEQTRVGLASELMALWERTRKTVVFITHGIEEAVTLADRVVVLSAHPGTVKAVIPIEFPAPARRGGVARRAEVRRIRRADLGPACGDARANARSRSPRRSRSSCCGSSRSRRASSIRDCSRRRRRSPRTSWPTHRAASWRPTRPGRLGRLIVGCLIGGIPGTLIGLAMGMNRWVRAYFQPVIALLYPIPKIAILPLLYFIFGTGEAGEVGGDRGRRVLPDGDQHRGRRAPDRADLSRRRAGVPHPAGVVLLPGPACRERCRTSMPASS